jgi:hypothetical protein
MFSKKVAALILLTISLFANESQLIFNDYNSYNRSGFVSGEVRMTSINHSATGYTDASTIGVYSYGTTVAMLFDNNFYVGGSIYTTGPDLLANGDVTESSISLTSFGGTFGIAPNSGEQLHLVYSAFLGLGVANDSRFSSATSGGIDWVVVFEPEVAVEVNMTNFTKMRMGLSWRMTQGVDSDHASNGWFSSSFMSGYGAFPSINLAVIFGEY